MVVSNKRKTHWVTDPDPALFVSDLKMPTEEKFFFQVVTFLGSYLLYIYISLQR